VLVTYSYLRNGLRGKYPQSGPYQVEWEDFQKFYANLPLDVRAMVVEFSEPHCGYKVWIWQRFGRIYKKGRRVQVKNHWQPVK